MNDYTITEQDRHWRISDGEVVWAAPTALDALRSVREHETEVAPVGTSAARIRWLTTSRIGLAVVRAVAGTPMSNTCIECGGTGHVCQYLWTVVGTDDTGEQRGRQPMNDDTLRALFTVAGDLTLPRSLRLLALAETDERLSHSFRERALVSLVSALTGDDLTADDIDRRLRLCPDCLQFDGEHEGWCDK